MLTFNSKIINIVALILLIYIAYMHFSRPGLYNDPVIKDEFERKTERLQSKYTITIDPGKHYEDFNIVEKFIYNLSKDKITPSVREKIESKKTVEHQ